MSTAAHHRDPNDELRASGLTTSDPADSRPWLNSFDEVGAIVRAFSVEVLTRHDKAKAAGDPTPLVGWLTNECLTLNRLFTGGGVEARPYRPDPKWNTEEQLGRSIISNMRIAEAEPRRAVADAFARLAAQLVRTVEAHGEEPMEAWGWQLKAANEDMVKALLGLPVVEPEG